MLYYKNKSIFRRMIGQVSTIFLIIIVLIVDDYIYYIKSFKYLIVDGFYASLQTTSEVTKI